LADERPPFPVEPETMSVLEALWSAGHGAYLVGGGVRDAILGLPVNDWDVATDADPSEILAIFRGSTYKNRFGTVLARHHEITTFRRDHRYADHRRPERITFSEDVYEDLARRDLTINAIAWGRRGLDDAARELDPADGRGDLEARLVRAVGDPGRRFDEDALRLLRAVRIAARLDFTIEPMTWAAMAAHADDIAWVSEERIGNEIRRMLGADIPSRAFRLMLDSGILAATMSDLAALAEHTDGTGSTDGTESTDRFAHALATLDAAATLAPRNERLALAALLHPIGPDRARLLLDKLRVAGRDSEMTCRLIDTLPVDYQPDWSDIEVRRYMRRAGIELLDDLLELRRAHSMAVDDRELAATERALRARVEAQRESGVPLTLADLDIDGRDIGDTLGLPESPMIGQILDQLLDDVIVDPRLNTRMTLLTRASLILERLVHGEPR
jgi:tRNA nucleotidyltransferase (CCA-adding enzyme)